MTDNEWMRVNCRQKSGGIRDERTKQRCSLSIFSRMNASNGKMAYRTKSRHFLRGINVLTLQSADVKVISERNNNKIVDTIWERIDEKEDSYGIRNI